MERVTQTILVIRGEKVLLEEHLAASERAYDAQFRVALKTIRDLMAPLPPRKKPIGFPRGTP